MDWLIKWFQDAGYWLGQTLGTQISGYEPLYPPPMVRWIERFFSPENPVYQPILNWVIPIIVAIVAIVLILIVAYFFVKLYLIKKVKDFFGGE